jgi:hypothetical protein
MSAKTGRGRWLLALLPLGRRDPPMPVCPWRTDHACISVIIRDALGPAYSSSLFGPCLLFVHLPVSLGWHNCLAICLGSWHLVFLVCPGVFPGPSVAPVPLRYPSDGARAREPFVSVPQRLLDVDGRHGIPVGKRRDEIGVYTGYGWSWAVSSPANPARALSECAAFVRCHCIACLGRGCSALESTPGHVPGRVPDGMNCVRAPAESG